MSNATNQSPILLAVDTFPKTAGVYLLTHSRTGDTYVGVTLNLRKRLKQHLRDLRAGTHYNLAMNDLARLGVAEFIVSVLEEIAPADRWPAEARWMKSLRPTLNTMSANAPRNLRPPPSLMVSLSPRIRVSTVERLMGFCLRHELQPTFSQVVQAALSEYLDREESKLPPKPQHKRGQ